GRRGRSGPWDSDAGVHPRVERPEDAAAGTGHVLTRGRTEEHPECRPVRVLGGLGLHALPLAVRQVEVVDDPRVLLAPPADRALVAAEARQQVQVEELAQVLVIAVD